METIKSVTKKINTTLSRSNIDENLIQFYRTCMEESWRHKWKVVRKWNVIVWKGSFSFFCLLAPLDSASDPMSLCLTKKFSIVICFYLRFKMLVFFLFTLLLSLSIFGPMVSYLIIYKKNTLKFKRRHSEFEWTKATQQLTLSPIGVADSGYFPLDHSSTNTADADTPAYRSTMLTACVFVTRDTLRHPRRYVFGKFVRKPNCSWSEAFVNGGLTVFHYDTQNIRLVLPSELFSLVFRLILLYRYLLS